MTRYFDNPSDPRKWRKFWKLLNQDPLPDLRPTTPDHQWQYQVIDQLQQEIKILRARDEQRVIEIRNLKEELDEVYNGILIT